MKKAYLVSFRASRNLDWTSECITSSLLYSVVCTEISFSVFYHSSYLTTVVTLNRSCIVIEFSFIFLVSLKFFSGIREQKTAKLFMSPDKDISVVQHEIYFCQHYNQFFEF